MPESLETTAIFRIDGEQSIGNVAQLLRSFLDLLGGESPGLVLDLANVSACDAAVLQLICSLRRTALDRGKSFRILAFSPAVETAAAALGLQMEELTGAHEDSQYDV